MDHDNQGEALETSSTSRRLPLVHLLLLVAAPLLVFSNTLYNGYHLDDFGRIAENPEISQVFPITRHFLDPRTSSSLPTTVQYRPLLPLSLSINLALAEAAGIEPVVAFHLGNIAFHILGTLLLYGFLCELLGPWSGSPERLSGQRRSLALVAALAFALHPISGVPVNYLAARDLLMMESFLLASLLVYVRMRRLGGSPWGWGLALLLLALSILSKTNAVVAPMLVAAFEFTVARQSPLRLRPWLRALPFGLVVASFFAFTELALDFSDAGQLLVTRSRLEYPLTQLKLHLVHYLRNFIWPFQMRPLPQLDPVAGLGDPWMWMGLLLVAGSLYGSWRVRRRATAVSFSILAYWFLLAPTSSVLPLRMLATDYRQYPSLPFLSLVVATIIFYFASRRLRWPLVTAMLLYFSISAFWMNRIWATEETLWAQSVKYGGSSIAHLNYGRSLIGRDDRQAEFHMQESLRLNPGNVFTHINLGLFYIRTGQADRGLQLVERAVTLAPNWGLAHYWLSEALSLLGRTEEAYRAAARASDLAPENIQWAYRAAWDAQRTGDFPASLVYLERVHRLGNAYKDSLFLRGFAHQRLGSNREAIEDYRLHLLRDPDHAQAHFNLAYALMETGSHAEAVGLFQRTLELKPDYREVHLHLARCFEALGNREAAAREMQLYRR